MTSTGSGRGHETCLILVDFDNAFPPNAAFAEEEIAVDVGRWLGDVANRFPDLQRVEIRLYGGWYDDRDLSRRGSEVAGLLSSFPDFPIRQVDGRILRGSTSLASTPLALPGGAPLLGTYRRRGSLPRVRLSRHPYPEDCAKLDAGCPAAILRSFTKHSQRTCPVDACSLRATDAFVAHEQKMVDTMLATDVLTAGHAPSAYSAIVVVSGDSDFVPPLLAANSLSDVPLVQLRPRIEEASAPATAVLVAAGIEVI